MPCGRRHVPIAIFVIIIVFVVEEGRRLGEAVLVLLVGGASNRHRLRCFVRHVLKTPRVRGGGLRHARRHRRRSLEFAGDDLDDELLEREQLAFGHQLELLHEEYEVLEARANVEADTDGAHLCVVRVVDVRVEAEEALEDGLGRRPEFFGELGTCNTYDHGEGILESATWLCTRLYEIIMTGFLCLSPTPMSHTSL